MISSKAFVLAELLLVFGGVLWFAISQKRAVRRQMEQDEEG